MKTLLVSFILLMAPAFSHALTPQQYCESIEAKSKDSVELLNSDSNQVKLCYKGRFCVGQRRGNFTINDNIRDIIDTVDNAYRYEGSIRIVKGRSLFTFTTSATYVACN